MDMSTFPRHQAGFPKLALKPTDLPPNPFWAQIIFAIHGHGGGCCNKQDYVLKYSQGITPLSQFGFFFFFGECLSLILCGAGTPHNPYSCWHLLGFYANDSSAFLTGSLCVLGLLQPHGPTFTFLVLESRGLTQPKPHPEPAANATNSSISQISSI